ncbi:MAG TPA: CHAD domain-containing protein, partial [Candidatus Acidoferrum sp.]|nr:CHAD domain-containing protein [Candidatus Acidoferrum sp.]
MTTERPVEIELKYRVRDVAAGERFLAADTLGPFKASSGARTAQHEDRYLDTSDGALARAGFAARLRQTNGTTVVTVKGTRPPDGALAKREELEGPADRGADPSDWPPSAARSLILELCGDAPLVELVTVRQLRRKRRLKAADATAELSLDEVDVVARGRVIDRFVELEVELTSGSEERLDELGRVLTGDKGLTPALGSKLDAALAASSADEGPADDPAPAEGVATEATAPTVRPRMVAPTRTKPPKDRAAKAAARAAASATAAASASSVEPPPGEDDVTTASAELLVVGKTPGVVADDIVAEAGRKVLRFHLARMIAREPGTRSGEDPEDLHSMRVATRRMRAAWRVFGDGFRADRTRRHRKRLRTVAGRLGAVRDLDVLIEAGEGYLGAQTKVEQRALEPLFTAWRSQRDDARALLLRELDSDAYARWVDEFRDFVRTDGLGAAGVLPTAPHRIRDTASSRIWAAYEVVRAYEPTLR